MSYVNNVDSPCGPDRPSKAAGDDPFADDNTGPSTCSGSWARFVHAHTLAAGSCRPTRAHTRSPPSTSLTSVSVVLCLCIPVCQELCGVNPFGEGLATAYIVTTHPPARPRMLAPMTHTRHPPSAKAPRRVQPIISRWGDLWAWLCVSVAPLVSHDLLVTHLIRY